MKRKNPLIAALIVVALIVMFLLAYLSYTKLVQKHTPEENIDNTDENTSEERALAPDFEVVDADGNTVKLYDFIGTPIVINYWASWCGPCKKEMPDFNEVYSEVGGDVQFMMINVVDGKRETESTGREYVESQGFEFPVYYDIGLTASLSYSITSYPTTIFIDEEGYFMSGYIGTIDKKTLLDAIDTLR